MSSSKVLGQFLGDEEFPVSWESAQEQSQFWVFDDLHCPHPVSPMYFDIGGWWLTCDHMFRRFATPFAVDWLAKNVNGYLYTAAIPADPGIRIGATEYGARYSPRVPTSADYAAAVSAYSQRILPVYGEHFADWWHDRLVPEMERNFSYLEAELARADGSSLMELACLLEDAMDIHDRHWKIHWMLNFAQLSATIALRDTVQRIRGSVDEELLGRLQNSAADRNWDAIEALWRMKEEAKADPVLTEALRRTEGSGILSALTGSERGRCFLAERLDPYQNEFGWRAVWSHEFIFPTFREQPEPVLDQIRDYLESDYDYPAAVEAVRRDLENASRELLDGLTGQQRDELDRANSINRKMAPLTPDHHFYIDQGANARVRMVLIAIGRRLVADGVLEQDDDVVFLRYNELRQVLGDPAGIDARGVVSARRQERAAAYQRRPRDWIGTVTEQNLAFPYLVNWGYPDRFYRGASDEDGRIAGISASPGAVEGAARVVLTVEDFDSVVTGDILVCQMTNPAWVVLFTKIAGLVTDTGGTTSHPAVLAREFGIPAVVGTSVATRKITTGDTIRVDGSLGVVEVLGRAAAAPAERDIARTTGRPTSAGRPA